MRKATVILWLNIVSFFNILSLATTGAIMRWVLPPGSGGGRGHGGGGWRGGRGAHAFDGPGDEPLRSLLGWGRHDWGDLHFWLAVLVVACITLHLALHWGWIKTNILLRIVGRGPRT